MLAMRRSSAAGVLHSQAVAKKVGINSTDLECLDLILTGGPATAGEIGRRTGLTSGAVTGLIDRLERQGLVERMSDADDRRKVLVRVRDDAVQRISVHFDPDTPLPGRTLLLRVRLFAGVIALAAVLAVAAACGGDDDVVPATPSPATPIRKSPFSRRRA